MPPFTTLKAEKAIPLCFILTTNVANRSMIAIKMVSPSKKIGKKMRIIFKKNKRQFLPKQSNYNKHNKSYRQAWHQRFPKQVSPFLFWFLIEHSYKALIRAKKRNVQKQIKGQSKHRGLTKLFRYDKPGCYWCCNKRN